MVFVDTWAWIALAVPRDQHHAAAKRHQAEFVAARREYVTTDYVLGEVVTQLFRVTDARKANEFVSTILAAIEAKTYRLEYVSPERFSKAWHMRCRYADKPRVSFVDFTSFVVMQELGIQDVFTGDAHFSMVNLGFRLFPEHR
jgi:predicted nucleic acid-binding protein